MKNKILSYEERPYPVGPEPDGGFNRTGQLIQVGMPEMSHIEVREALMVKPYYLGHEKKFYDTLMKYPTLAKILFNK